MKYLVRFISGLFLVLVIVAGAAYAYLAPEDKPAPVASDNTLIKLDTGDIIGFQNSLGVSIWRGVPFAQPPVGDLRWRAPRPPASWQQPRQMLDAGPDCANQANNTSEEKNLINGSEDCLYLNVFAPENAKDLPVMFWIHGGANNGGTSNHPMLDGSQLASQFDVVVVSINYRLSAFGWLSHPALRANAELPEDHSSNFGTLDQIAGLKWVQRNIAKFGGDANKVTIFGESAGGWNVMALMASPLAADLFHGAIVQSGGLDIEPIAKAENFIEDGGHEHSSREFINQLLITEKRAANREDAKKLQNSMTAQDLGNYLRNKTTAEIYKAYRSDTGGKVFRNLDLIGDGIVLPEAVASEKLFADPTNYNAVPVILGTNRDEMKLFLGFSPDQVDRFMGIPIAIKNSARYAAFSSYASDQWKIKSVDQLATVMRKGQGDSVFAYRFDADDLRDFGFLSLQELMGAAHAFEIPFVFGNFVTLMSNVIHPESARAARNALSQSMMSYWASFAHYGAPAKGYHGKQIEWAAWSNNDEQNRIIIFDSSLDRGIRMSPMKSQMQDLKQNFINETRFNDQEEHCQVYKLLFTNADFVQSEYDNLGDSGCSGLDS
ncbi:MAG: carboxylesterase family protein [Porticoccaceae bacterium]|nr:carboxylesterase family protein [Porticoccaceae bacterium]